VNYTQSTTIKIEALKGHKTFSISKAGPVSSEILNHANVPALPLCPDVLDQEAKLETYFVELHFETPSGRLISVSIEQ